MRSLLFLLCLFCGAVAIVTGLLIPAHLRAADPYVLREMLPGKTVPKLAAETAERDPAVAKMLLLASEKLNLPETEEALEVLRETRNSHRTILSELEEEAAGPAVAQEVPVLTALRPESARSRLIASLETAEARQVLKNRTLTNTTLFAPVHSAAGFPLEAAILTTAFLVDRRSFEPGLHEDVLRVCGSGRTGEIEEFYINMLSLARRFSSAQLAGLVNYIDDIQALDIFTRALQNYPESVPILYSAAVASRNGTAVANYLRAFPTTAIADLSYALALGTEPLNHLLTARLPLFRSTVYDEFAGDARLRNVFSPLLELATGSRGFALFLKFVLLLTGAALLVAATRLRSPPAQENYVSFGQFNFIRRAAATAVLLLLLVILGEPYLARGGGEPVEQPRIYFSFAALAAPATGGEPSPKANVMLDPQTILAIVTFLVLQGAIYIVCLVKLAEIRKQPVPSATKLKLLDNEENLFDGGLYCGLFGTAASLILLTIGVIKPSLISAYSSTLFGILFVALVKIIHVRPYKRRLILETTEMQTA